MRVMHVITPSRVSGAEHVVLRVSREQMRQGMEVRVICKPLAAFLMRAQAEGVDAVPARISGKFNLRAVFALTNAVREFNPDVINTHLSTATLWGVLAAQRMGVPVVATMHAANSIYPYNRAPALVAVADAVREHLILRGVYAPNITTVHNGIDPAPFLVQQNSDQLRLELGIPSNAFCIGTVAHLTPRKGHQDLLNAAPNILRRVPDAQFLWVGEGPLRKQLQAQAEAMGIANRIHMLGYRNDIAALLQLFDVFVLPSLVEGLPLVLLEAMASARACVATRVAGSPELVVNGETGLLVAPHDVDALGIALIELAVNPCLRQQMGIAGQRRVLTNFTLTESVAKLRLVYEAQIARLHYGRAGMVTR